MQPRVWSRRRPVPSRPWVIPLLAVVVLTIVSVGWFGTESRPIGGHARAVDGDTLDIGNRRIRLVGLDAPELEQSCTDAGGAEWPCGQQARAFLVGLLKGRVAACAGSGRDAYGRLLATCQVDGEDLGAEIVAAGWATADLAYLGEQGAARDTRVGIWSGSFVTPVEWRRAHNGAATPAVWEWIRSWFQ